MALQSGFSRLNGNNTFSDWLNKTNETADLIRGDNTGAQTSIMTANSSKSWTHGDAVLSSGTNSNGEFFANIVSIIDGSNTTSGGLQGAKYTLANNTFEKDWLYISTNTAFSNTANIVYVNATDKLHVTNNTEINQHLTVSNTGGYAFFHGNTHVEERFEVGSQTTGAVRSTTVDSLIVTGANVEWYDYSSSTTSSIRTNDNGDLIVDADVTGVGTANTTITLRVDNSDRATLSAANIDFYNAAGSTVGMRWTGSILELGEAQGFQIYNDTTDSFIKETSSGNLFVQANNLVLEATDGTNYFVGTAAANTTIHYGDGTKTIEVSNAGIDIIGEANTDTLRVTSDAQFENGSGVDKLNWEASNEILNWEDNAKATFGADDDLQIYHDGLNSYIRDQGTGRLYATSSNFRVTNAAGNETMIDAVQNGAVSLWYDGSSKFATSAGGVIATGNVVADGFVGGDNDKLLLGDGLDLQLYHDGSNSFVTAINSGNLKIFHSNNNSVGANGGIDISETNQVNIISPFNDNDLNEGTINIRSEGISGTGNSQIQLFGNEISLSAKSSRFQGSGNNALVYVGGSNIGGTNYGPVTLRQQSSASANGYISGDNYVETDRYSNLHIGISANSSANFEKVLSVSPNSGVSSISLYYNGGEKLYTVANGVVVNTTLTSPNVNVTGVLDAANVVTDYLTVNTDASFPDGVSFAGTTEFVNIEVTGTANILSLEVSELVANGAALVGTEDTVTTTSATVIDSYPKAQSKGLKYIVQGQRSDLSTAIYGVEIMLVHNGTDVFYTRYGEIDNQMSDVVITPVANATHINLQAVCDSASVANTHTFNIVRIETR